MVEFLVEKDADIHVYNDSPLAWSACNGHLHIVEFLVENGANIHENDDFALTWSAKYGERIGTFVPFSTCPLGTRSFGCGQIFG